MWPFTHTNPGATFMHRIKINMRKTKDPYLLLASAARNYLPLLLRVDKKRRERMWAGARMIRVKQQNRAVTLTKTRHWNSSARNKLTANTVLLVPNRKSDHGRRRFRDHDFASFLHIHWIRPAGFAMPRRECIGGRTRVTHVDSDLDHWF